MKNKLKEYLRSTIDDFDERADLALSVIGRNRCSLEHADPALAYEMSDLAEVWCEENQIEMEFDLEDLL